ncbi:unnamed protein product, partial [Darwinula stevensoni]
MYSTPWHLPDVEKKHGRAVSECRKMASRFEVGFDCASATMVDGWPRKTCLSRPEDNQELSYEAHDDGTWCEVDVLRHPGLKMLLKQFDRQLNAAQKSRCDIRPRRLARVTARTNLITLMLHQLDMEFRIGNEPKFMDEYIPEELFGSLTFQNVEISWHHKPSLQSQRNAFPLKKIIPMAILPFQNSLVNLTIQSGNLEDFPFHILHELNLLKYLDLSGNSLTSIPTLKSKSILILHLRNNKITRVEGDRWETLNLKELDLSSNSLTSIPVLKFGSLEILDLRFNRITRVNGDELETPNLKELDLSSNSLTSIPALKFGSLEIMDLQKNNITRIEGGGWETPNLKKLDLSWNSLTTVSALKIHSLETLNLRSNKINQVEGHGLETPNLKKLDLSSNSLTSIPALKFGSLEILDLMFNNITRVEGYGWETPNLKKLDLSWNSLTTVPALKIGSLEILHLGFNMINRVEGDELETPNLKELDLSSNSLTSIPALKFDRLEIVDLQNNVITRVEGDKLETPNLEELDLSSNSLTSVPALKIGSLEILHLGFNMITRVEGDELETPNLKKLDLSSNSLTSIPALKFGSLEIMDLQKNNITGMDGGGWETPNLKKLDLSWNSLTTVPALKLHSLEILNLGSNKITRVEGDGLETPNLKKLDLSLNSLTSAPALKFVYACNAFRPGPRNSSHVQPARDRAYRHPHLRPCLPTLPNRLPQLAHDEFRARLGIIVGPYVKDHQHLLGWLGAHHRPDFILNVFNPSTRENDILWKKRRVNCEKVWDSRIVDATLPEEVGKNNTECIKHDRYETGTVVEYECNQYYILKESRRRICKTNGQWSGRNQFCEPGCGRRVPLGSSAGGKPSVIGKWPWQAAIYDVKGELLICGGALIREDWVLTAARCLALDGTARPRPKEDFLVYLGKHYRNDSLDDEFVEKRKVVGEECHGVCQQVENLQELESGLGKRPFMTSKVSTVILHSGFNRYNFDSDIALLKLSHPVELTERVQLICLPTHQFLHFSLRLELLPSSPTHSKTKK